MISDERLRAMRACVENCGAADLVDAEVLQLLAEVESLRDSTLQKDFLALYQAAAAVVDAHNPALDDPELRVEGLALHVRRLAPLYDDVRMNLNLRSAMAREAARTALGGAPLPFVLRGAVPIPPGGEPRRSEVDLDDVNLTLAPPHTVRVMHEDGSESVECDHTFKGTTRCVHCGKSFAELRAESQVDLARLQPQLPDGVLHAPPDELAAVIQTQLDEHEGAGILTDTELAVPVELGPSLRPRIEALVATHRLGSDIERVVQTLFVLGMLAAEGQDPEAHVGEPMLHVSAQALFVRFGLPHEGDAKAAQQRAATLRQLFVDLSEWCDEGDPLRTAFAAAIEALPR